MLFRSKDIKKTETIRPVSETVNAKKQQVAVQVKNVQINHEAVKNKPMFQQDVENHSSKILTEKEEEIAWNVWRSNLQNQIMRDVKLPILPNGIVFRFSFNVDKYGKITNIYTYSDNSLYTPYAVQYIAPVIRSYQGKTILNFPEGSSRLATEFKGGWKISSSERLSRSEEHTSELQSR